MKTTYLEAQKPDCPNGDCASHDSPAKRRVIRNGTYTTGSGALTRYLCQACGRTFSERSGGSFFRIRSDFTRVRLAFRMLAEGMPIVSVAKVLESKPDTVRRWIRVLAESDGERQGEEARALGLLDAELKELRDYVAQNRMKERAFLWRVKGGGGFPKLPDLCLFQVRLGGSQRKVRFSLGGSPAAQTFRGYSV